ncbi:hypothetical protein N7488_010146 [Penicillium malachiteum]|nr:hypothetical protein N7488_010146 [Penicillium malachiteum]
MSVRSFIYAYRKPGLSLAEFKTHYEAHAALLKEIAGEDFLNETISHAPHERNALTPAIFLVGQQTDFDFDAYAELTFVDQAAFQAFCAKVYAPEAAARIAADKEKFLDKSKLGIAMIGDVIETTK